MKDDKRKIAIVGVLVAAVLGIGAWQFSSSMRSPGQKKAAKAQTPSPGTKGGHDPIVANLDMIGLSRRNPFQPLPLAGVQPADSESTTVVVPDQTPSGSGRSGSGSGSRAPVGPNIPPWTFDQLASGTSDPGVVLNDSQVMRSPDEFAYALVGVVEGPQPIAVFRGDDGHQKMVRLNESMGSNSKVVGIQSGQVKVQHNGKTITLSVGGN